MDFDEWLACGGEMAFAEWLTYGFVKGWATSGCATHGGVPTTEAENDAFERGEDPCLPVLRVWGEGGKPA